MTQNVYLVYWNNYGDQGVDPLGVFSAINKAHQYILNFLIGNKLQSSEIDYFQIQKIEIDNPSKSRFMNSEEFNRIH